MRILKLESFKIMFSPSSGKSVPFSGDTPKGPRSSHTGTGKRVRGNYRFETVLLFSGVPNWMLDRLCLCVSVSERTPARVIILIKAGRTRRRRDAISGECVSVFALVSSTSLNKDLRAHFTVC